MAKKKVDPHSKTKRNRDLVAIRDLFSVIPRPLVDQVLEQALADRILTDHIDCLTAAESNFRSTLFHLYDRTLWQRLDDLFRNWDYAWDVGSTSAPRQSCTRQVRRRRRGYAFLDDLLLPLRPEGVFDNFAGSLCWIPKEIIVRIAVRIIGASIGEPASGFESLLGFRHFFSLVLLSGAAFCHF